MADFRKWFYALAVVALLAGLTVPASAQTPLTPFTCTAQSGTVVPLVRAEGLTELVGDVVLYCTGGQPTVIGHQVPQVNLTVFLNTNITSRITASVGTVGGTIQYNEALLLVDEPNAPGTTRPILNCGAPSTTETDSTNNPGVCSITSTGVPAETYNGTAYHPNVFQGRLGVQQNPGQFNAITFAGVPIDPPGTTTTRVFRITNVRANANAIGVSSTFTQSQIQMNIAINGPTTMSINNPQVIVAYVNRGLSTSVSNKRLDYVQCQPTNYPWTTTTTASTGTATTPAGYPTGLGGTPLVRFTEGFNTAWKTKNVAFYLAGGNADYSIATGYVYHPGATNYPTPDAVQNVPGATYNTESGFLFRSTNSIPSPNPPLGFGTQATAGGTPFQHATTGIAKAGEADHGTRLSLSVSNIPAGTTLWAPRVINLRYQGTGNTSGVMVATTTSANGEGPYTTGSGSYVQVTGLLVYEVLFADVNALEFADVPLVISYTPNLSANLPAPGVIMQAVGGFAPFYGTTAAGQPSATLPIPRFVPGTGPLDILMINKCACNLLFPYVVSAAGFDTGLAIANTSSDPGATYGFYAVPQAGKVTMWYYGVMANGGAVPGPQSTNKNVPTGTVLTYVASSGNSDYGLDGRAAGLIGYMITQAEFQYCHAVAYISALGAGPLTPGASEMYLGLELDWAAGSRTIYTSEVLGH